MSDLLPEYQASTADVTAIVGGYHGAPHTILGLHRVAADGVATAQAGVVIRAFRPLDRQLFIYLYDRTQRVPMVRTNPAGFFEQFLPGVAETARYHLILVDGAGQEHEIEDPYRFGFYLTDYELYLHGEGNFFQSYCKLGAQMRTVDGVQGVNFAVWAPNAQRVSVIGAFNGWDTRTHAMSARTSGIWELFIPNLPVGTAYKYAIKSIQQGHESEKSDPYAFYSEMRPHTASRVWPLDQHEWQDEAWMAARVTTQALDKPINIYEVHLGSWKRVPSDNGFLNYRDLARELVAYAKEMGYTHLELLPITEHPFDGSWGYQATGYFAPTSRFGSPSDFMAFVDYCHQAGIGVILDWVPAHFPRDAHGLGFFDGTHLYEHADPRLGEHRDWGTKIFNFGRNEVRNFLLSSALFWLKVYHLDGLRVDAVASMLYLDYSREAGDWVPNRYGGRENLEAIDFLRRFNELVHTEAPGAITFAEESTSWPMVTRPAYAGGLGFDYKWNMGWMHDMLSYMEKDPIYRRYHQNQITFSLVYAFSENFVLPFSHDEVVHLKHSMLDKMPGDLWRKFANLRALYAYMTSHPGKKLLFMGGEFGQWREWSEARSLDWHLLAAPEHQQLQNFVKALNHLYLQEPALHQVDASWEGFAWIDLSDADQSVISYTRYAHDRNDLLVVVCNFTPLPRHGYRIGLPIEAAYREILNSDWRHFGGSGVENQGLLRAEAQPWQNCPFSTMVSLPPLGVLILKPMQL